MKKNNTIKLVDEAIERADLKLALTLLRSDFLALDTIIADDILIVIGKLNELERRNNLNLLTYQEYSVEISKITYSTINLKQKLNELNKPKPKKWDIIFDTKNIEYPQKIKNKRVLFKNEIEFDSVIEFDNCYVICKDAKLSINKFAKISFTNCTVLFNKVVVIGNQTIGEDIQITDSDIEVNNCVFSDLNRIDIVNNLKKERKVEIIKCVFNDFKQSFSIENSSNEYVIIDNCIFSDFKNGFIYLNCGNIFVKKSVFNDCNTGIQAVIKKPNDSLVISNCVFSDIKKVGIDFWIHSNKSKNIITDTTCSDCEVGIRIQLKKEIYAKKALGEIKTQETLIIHNSHYSNCKTNLKIENFE